MAEKKTHKKRSFIVSLCIIAACAYFAISFFSITKEIRETKRDTAEVISLTNQQIAENDELREKLNSENKDEYVESAAREKLGYVMPGERVYYDISVTD